MVSLFDLIGDFQFHVLGSRASCFGRFVAVRASPALTDIFTQM